MSIEPLRLGLVALKQEVREMACALFTTSGHSKKTAFYKQEEEPHQELDHAGTPILDF